MHPQSRQLVGFFHALGSRLLVKSRVTLAAAVGCLSLHCAQGESLGTEDGLTYSSSAPEIGKLVDKDGIFCSGTLIADDVVLTAAHCVLDLHGPIAFKVYTADDAQILTFDVAQAEYNPAYADGSYVHDVGLMKLSQPVPSEVARPRAMTNESTPRGTHMTIWGYSSKATSNTGDCKKHYVAFDWPDKTTLIWLGDSGGPVIRTDSAQIARVVSGILDNSFVAIDLSAPINSNWDWLQSSLTLLE